MLDIRNIQTFYGKIQALRDVSIKVNTGEIVSLIGANGAGKSTFVRQITGVEQRTRGTVIFDGQEVDFKGPIEARESGIETVFQTLALADHLDVPDNLFFF